MKWPTGKYNGLRIVGFRVTFSIDVRFWTRCYLQYGFGMRVLRIGPILILLEAEYDNLTHLRR